MKVKATQFISNTEKNLTRILDTLDEGILAHDLEQRIFFFNRAAERITGYSREEVLGKICYDIFPNGGFCGTNCHFCEGKPMPGNGHSYPITIFNKSGDPRRIQMNLAVMEDDQGSTFGVLAAFTDNTEFLMAQMEANTLNQFANIVGQTPQMHTVFRQIQDVAQYDVSVHIHGATGTGKELVARAIHEESRRAGAPFVAINCGALPESLIESELFGHVKGAFTGAIADRRGRFELADKGTVFLDEVSELPKHLQVKLLRFLQEGTFEKVGGEKTISVDVRVISASNKDLKLAIDEDTFREDLFYRLNVFPIQLPSLRQRQNDIPLLAEHFLALYTLNDTSGRTIPKSFSSQSMQLLLHYPWPGNVRELQNAVLHSIVKCHAAEIQPAHLPIEILEFAQYAQIPHPLSRGKLSKSQVLQALQQTGGNRTKAAKVLRVSRATLYRFLDEHPELLTSGKNAK